VQPNLFIVGAPKCGTTAWAEYLRSHSDIQFSELKEPHFYASDLVVAQQITSPERYAKLFAGADSAKYAAEASPLYMYSSVAAQAIREASPDARILVFLRPQEDFLRSWHHQLLYAFQEQIEDLATAWRLSGKRPPETIPETCLDARLLDYASIASFREQVQRFVDAFGEEQVRAFHFHEWTSDPRRTYLQILEFLGLPDDGRTDFPRLNEAKSHGNRWLGRLIWNPPKVVSFAVELIKKVTGRARLGLGERAARLIAVKGYRTEISPELEAEIRSYYAAENAALERLVRNNHGGG
jgi:hypothetical protein